MKPPPTDPARQARNLHPTGAGAGPRTPPGRRLREWVIWLSEPDSNAPGDNRLPRWFLPFLLLFGAGMILISLIGDQGLIAYSSLRSEAARLRSAVSALADDNVRLAREIEALQTDDAYIEHLARRKLGLVRRGDVVLQLPRRPARP